jgi:hypothetical protein
VRSPPDAERQAVAAAVTVREVETDSELEQAASLRAEAYYEDQVRRSCRSHTHSPTSSRKPTWLITLTTPCAHAPPPPPPLLQVHNRFVDSFKKQFKEQESRCVRGRIHERRKLNFACLVAMHEVSEGATLPAAT